MLVLVLYTTRYIPGTYLPDRLVPGYTRLAADAAGVDYISCTNWYTLGKIMQVNILQSTSQGKLFIINTNE